MLLGDTDGVVKPDGRGRPSLISHENMESYLGRYAGLMLYLKEMDESLYAKLCAVSSSIDKLNGGRYLTSDTQAYFSAVSQLHNNQIKSLLADYASSVKKALDDDQEPRL
jgi:exocyst complex component 1